VVRDALGGDPQSGALFVFRSKHGTRLKCLWWDSTGYCLLYKRLSRGSFRFPEVTDPSRVTVMIDAHELALLLQGVQLSPRKMHPKQIANQSREKALRAISSLTTDSVRE
jgi:transposase